MPANDGSAGKRERQLWTIANTAAIAGLIFFALYYLTAFRFDTLFTVPARQVDFFLWRFIPSYILDHSRYPAVVTGDWEHAVFPYLPSAAVMMLPLSWPPAAIGFAIWLLIEAGCFAVVLWAGLCMSGAMRLRARWIIAIISVLLAENSLGWDFRNHNTNIVYLALLMLGMRASSTWLAGSLFALSINLKLYSGLIPVALYLRGEYRLAVLTCLMTVLFAVLLPAVVFGPTAFLQLGTDWFAQIRYLMDVHSSGTASLIRSVATLLAADPGAGIVSLLLHSTQVIWLILVALYYVIASRAERLQGLHGEQARLADLSVALLTPLPLSIVFIPYHAVVMLPIYMLLLTIAISEETPKWLRGVAIGSCVAFQLALFAVPDWNYRGAVFLFSFAVLLITLGALRLTLARMAHSLQKNLMRSEADQRYKRP